ncbi:MAG: KpsF/GutQ family sugar-phosphate isomerase [Elusimicrobia bacterium CG_4_8_14_3_um_filter_50_9]|nr:MAG: KpsF/GutQ family sugar-phosphate isomerase [Elusimicrobia bacterium CG_4_8_14_3_um_filter_50_9]
MKIKTRTVREILSIEKKAIEENINPAFSAAVEKSVNLLFKRKSGKIAVMGLGKSGLVAKKIAATLSSTGSPAFFIHPGEAAHGDIGMLNKGDSIIALSFSGEIAELASLLPLIKKLKIPVISITARPESALGKIASCLIPIKASKQACPFNHAPTSSTTVMMVTGDAIAITLMQKKKLQAKDLALLHPGGVLGKKLSMQVRDIMRKGKDCPELKRGSSIKKALFEMTRSRLGAVCIIDRQRKLGGFFTDGDLRRLMQGRLDVLNEKIETVMTKKPFSVLDTTPAWKVAEIMNRRNFDNIPVVDKSGKLAGIIDERDLLREGLAG